MDVNKEIFFDEKRIPKNPIGFAMFISKLYKRWAIGSLIAVFIGTALSRLSVLTLSKLTDAISAKSLATDEIWLWAVSFVALFLIAESIWRASGFLGMNWFMNFRFAGYRSLYEYLTLHSKDYFNNRFAGSLSNKITNAVDGTQNLLEKTLWQFIPLGLGLLWFCGFAFYSNLWLGLIIAIWSVLFLLVNIWFAKKMHPLSFHSAQAGSTLKGNIVDSLSNISLVHEYANTSGEHMYIRNFAEKDRKAGLILWNFSEWMLVVNGILIFVFMFLMIGTSLVLFQQKTITAGVIIMVVAIVTRLSDQLLFLGSEIRDATRYYGEAKEGLEEILKEHIIVDSDDAKILSITKGTIDIESMNFQYDSTQVFKNFSLTIPAGQKVGLVGKSGAGKTTFVSLLLRHFDIQKGNIKIDGQNIAEVTLESLRKSIAFVPQDTSLFHRTILENIRYSNPNASQQEVENATKLANADDFIRKLPKGYDTAVGERGVKLSGGQRQRIAIARAFLKNAPILILDEATSSLDSESERSIQLALEELMKDRTVIAIAHRLSTLKEMDRIIVIKEGVIVEDGKPDELLTNGNGIFKNMWDHQVKGFIIDE